MSENLTDSALQEAQPSLPEPEPWPMYPRSPGEAQDMIQQRQADILAAQKRMAEDSALVNQLGNEIAVLNSLRQANGQAPL